MFKAPLVVGYKGEIGSFILAGLLKVMPKALNIWCFDINETEKEKIDRIKKSDYIFLCVPLEETRDWLIRYRKHLKDKVIVEQCSVKYTIFNLLGGDRFDDLKFISMHLLFRPSGTPNIRDRRCILLRPVSKWFIDVIKEITQSEIIVMSDTKEHDDTMAYTQGIVHRVILSLNSVIGNYPKTYVSGKIRELANRILQGDPKLYSAIQDNPEMALSTLDFQKTYGQFKMCYYMDVKGVLNKKEV